MVDGKGDHGAVLDDLTIETHAEVESKHYKDMRTHRGDASTGSRDDGIVVKRQAEEDLDVWMDSLELESRGTGRCMSVMCSNL